MANVIFLEGKRLSEAQATIAEPFLREYRRGEITKMMMLAKVKQALQKAKIPLHEKTFDDFETADEA
jgi:hypothetical protein